MTQAIDPADLDAALALAAGLADRLGDVPCVRTLIATVVAESTKAQAKH